MHIAQFIKLEIIILNLLINQDLTSEQIYCILNKHFTIIEGELLVSLFFLHENHLISFQTVDDCFIYHIEEAGLVRYTTLKREYQNIHQVTEELFQNEKTKI